MKISAFLAPTRDRWLRRPLGSAAFKPWLLSPGSLTKRLQQHSQQFRVQAISQKRQPSRLSETSLLRLPARRAALLRDVLLHCDDQPVVFAHSVLPVNALAGGWRQLPSLGNRSLGSTLFADPRTCRTRLQFKKLYSGHFLYKLVGASQAAVQGPLWARRSVFRLQGRAILVTEVFLPAVLALQEQTP